MRGRRGARYRRRPRIPPRTRRLSFPGFAAPDTGNAYARARELWERLGSPSEYLHIPYGQSRYHMVRGELRSEL